MSILNIYCNKFIYPSKKRGICKPKFVKIALSELKYPANAQPKAPKPCINIFNG